MLKLKAKYLLSICVFLLCGVQSAFGSFSYQSYRASSPGFYIFTDTHSFAESDLNFHDKASHVAFDQLRKQAAIENDVVEAEEYEEASSLRKSAENPELYATSYYKISIQPVFNYNQLVKFVHGDTLYPCLDRYIVLQVFRI